MRAALSVLFWIYFTLSSAVLFLVALALFALTIAFDRRRAALHWFASYWASHYLAVNPLWRIRVEGTAVAARGGPFIIASNHQSLADILALFATHLPFKWVSKRSVFNVPFLGWNMRLVGYVPLVRGDRSSVEKMAAACRGWLARGVSILIFPEGTRSKDGELGPFKPGAFRMAREAGVPVLPVVLDGTADVLPKHGVVLSTRSDIRVRVLPPIDVSGDDSDGAAADRVRAVIADELQRMRRE